MKNSILKGTGVALVTPFKNDGSVDFDSLQKITERCIENKVDYLVPLGTTGESVTLSKEEKKEVLKTVVKTNNGRVPVVLGLGGNNTGEILEAIEHTSFEHIKAILSVSPYYNKPSQKGIYQHYKTIAETAPVPVILYNVPSRTASTIEAETTLALAHDVKNIIGIKEASGSLERVMRIVKERPKDFLVISGDDILSLPIIACGGDGVISVIANALPGEFSQMIRFALKGEFAKAAELHYKLLDITQAIYIDGNPAGVKGLLSLMNMCLSNVRLPLVPATKSTLQKFEEMLMAKA